MSDLHPTSQMYSEIEQAFDFFNAELFDGALPRCIITLQRTHDTFGYFSRERFVKSDGSGDYVSEIALNPSFMTIHPIEFTLSVLGSQMVSLHQLQTGEPGRRRYKNKQWAEMMEKIGLMPSDTGMPGGKRVGEKVSHYIISGGKFDEACKKLVDEQYRLSWLDRYPPMPDASLLDEEDRSAGGDDTSGAAALLEATNTGGGEQGISHFAGDGDGDDEGGDDLFNAAHLTGSHTPAEGGHELPLDSQGNPASAAPAGPKPNAPPAPEQPAMKTFEKPGLETLKSLGVEVQEEKKQQSRARYGCPSCNTKVWGKPGLRIRCLNCEEEPEMVRNDAGAPTPEPAKGNESTAQLEEA